MDIGDDCLGSSRLGLDVVSSDIQTLILLLLILYYFWLCLTGPFSIGCSKLVQVPHRSFTEEPLPIASARFLWVTALSVTLPRESKH